MLSDVIVATHLGGTWRDVWTHQVRWARTIRVSKFSGYLGLPVTFATVWAVVAACAGEWRVALAVLAVRMLMALASGWMVMRSREVLRLWFLIPLARSVRSGGVGRGAVRQYRGLARAEAAARQARTNVER